MATERLGRAVLELATEGFAAIQGDLNKIDAGVTKISGHADALSSGLSKVGSSLVAAFTVAAVGKVVGDFIEMSGALVDLEAKTGISVTGLQKLKGATQESGVELETVAKAATQLQKRLGEGKDSFVGALESVGLNYRMIRDLSPEEAFLAVGDAIGKITDQNQKVALTNELLGKQGVELLPALNGQLKETADAYERMGLVIDEKVIRSGDQLGDQWTVLKSTGSALLAEVIGPLLPGLVALTGGLLSVGHASAPVLKFFLELIGLPFAKVISLISDLGESFDLLALNAGKLPDIKPPKLDVPKAGGLGVLGLEEMKRIEDELTEKTKQSIQEHEKRAAVIQREADAAKRFHDAWSGADSFASAQKLTDEIERLGGVEKLTADEQRRALSTLEDALDKYRALGQQAPADVLAVAIQLDALVTKLKDATAHTLLLGDALDTALTPPPILSTFDPMRSLAPLRAAVQDSGTGIGAGLGTTMLQGLKGTFANQFGPTIMAAITGGGNIGQAIGGLLGQSITTSLSGFLERAAPRFMQSFLGQTIGAFLPGIGALLGPALGKLTEWFSGLFGVSKEVQQARSELDKFRTSLEATATASDRNEAAMSGWGDKGALTLIRVRNALQAIGGDASRADALIARLLNTDRPDDMRAAMAEINAILDQEKKKAADAAAEIERQQQAFEDAKEEAGELVSTIDDLAEKADGLPDSVQPYIDKLLELGLITQDQADHLHALRREGEVDWKAMKDAAEKYGVDIDSLGGKFQGAKIHASAQQIINDFGLLTRGGADVGGVLVGMKDEIGSLVRDSIKFGTTIPANMKPWIEELRRTKQLVDENGDQIKDLDKIHYGDELKDEALIARDGFAGIITKLDELIAKITGPLATALDEISKDRTINVDVDYRFTDPPVARDGNPDRNVPLTAAPINFDVGVPGRLGSLFADFKGGTLARLHGVETVLTPDQLATMLEPRMPRIVDSLDLGPIDRSNSRDGNRDSGGERNVTVVAVPVLMQQRPDLDAISDHVVKRMPEDVVFNKFDVRSKLIPVLADAMKSLERV